MALTSFTYCPLRSRFIDTADDARSYYAHKFVGDHAIRVKGSDIVIRFNTEEIHHFTETTPCNACPGCTVVARTGSTERRCFSRERARRLDDILPSLQNAARIHEAKIRDGVLVYGPATANTPRLGIVIAPDRGVWFVRTAFPVSAKAFAQACGSGRPSPWPPK